LAVQPKKVERGKEELRTKLSGLGRKPISPKSLVSMYFLQKSIIEKVECHLAKQYSYQNPSMIFELSWDNKV